MIRKLGAAAAALLCVAGLAAGAEAEAPAAARSAQAQALLTASAIHGDYVGKDHRQKDVTFTYAGNEVKNFKVGHVNLGNAHISGSAWHERCSNGYCFKGHWVAANEVVGFWKEPHGHWVPWNAFITVTRTNFQGNYSGYDHRGGHIHLNRHNDFVQHFKVGHDTFPSVRVDSHGAWSATCNHDRCYSGHWQDDYHVVGYWWWKADGHKVAWEAHAYSAR